MEADPLLSVAPSAAQAPRWSPAGKRVLVAVAVVAGVATFGSVKQFGSRSTSFLAQPGPPFDETHPGETLSTSKYSCSDALATVETLGLFQALGELTKKDSFLFGHQYDNYIGQYFLDKTGTKHQSDVFNGTGSYPGLFGYDWTEVINEGINFTEHVKFAYSQNGVIEFDWLPDNPQTAGDYKDTDGSPCAEVVKGSGPVYDTWVGWLDQIAEQLRTFKYEGTSIPVIFRFLHETTGRWYWWGIGSNSTGGKVCSDEDYIGLWNVTQDYLHNYHDIHQLLWLYAPSKPSSRYEQAFEERYPGDDRVDLIGFDQYSSVDWYNETILDDCATVTNFSSTHDKIAVIAETGISDGIQDVWDDKWFYREFAKKFMTDKYCQRIAYALSWENSHPDFYWVPLPQDRTWEGFYNMYLSDWAIFADDSKWVKYLEKYGYINSARR